MENLQWIKEGDKFHLKNNEEVLVDLSFKLNRHSNFSIHNKKYTLVRKGFWNPSYFIFQEDKEMVKLSHSFWGSAGKIIFNDGTNYKSIYKSNNGIKLLFLDGNEEILFYEIIFSERRSVMRMKIGISLIDAEKILFLSVLGFVMFYSIFLELKGGTDNTISILYNSRL